MNRYLYVSPCSFAFASHCGTITVLRMKDSCNARIEKKGAMVASSFARAICSVVAIAIIIHGACFGQAPDGAASTPGGLESGRRLAQIWCQRCHLFPEPSLLPRSEWMRGVLPGMALLLGVSRLNLEKRPDGAILLEAGIFPAAPLLANTDWHAIVSYYSNAAPETVEPPKRIESVTDLFVARPLLRSSDAPCTSLLQIDPEARRIYVGDAQTRTLRVSDYRGNVLKEWKTDSGPVSLSRVDGNLLVTLIGRILPSDELTGQVWQLDGQGGDGEPVRLLRGLRRPVQTQIVRLENLNKPALVVACFGNRLGRLSMFTPADGGSFSERVIAEGTGTVRCLPYDWNGDGLMDLTVLRAQGREGADLYINMGAGQFKRHVLWDDPPTYGNVFFELTDFDGDGRPELVVVNGDNGDFKCGPRPCHGVRVYSVDLNLKAEKRFQYPIPGAYHARAADFDLDGDIDIAVVAYFPDYEHGFNQSFVLLKNEGGWKFSAHTMPGLSQGRWILMDAADLDGDGDTDLVLGSFSRGPLTVPVPAALSQEWERDRVAVLLLENTTRKAGK